MDLAPGMVDLHCHVAAGRSRDLNGRRPSRPTRGYAPVSVAVLSAQHAPDRAHRRRAGSPPCSCTSPARRRTWAAKGVLLKTRPSTATRTCAAARPGLAQGGPVGDNPERRWGVRFMGRSLMNHHIRERPSAQGHRLRAGAVEQAFEAGDGPRPERRPAARRSSASWWPATAQVSTHTQVYQLVMMSDPHGSRASYGFDTFFIDHGDLGRLARRRREAIERLGVAAILRAARKSTPSGSTLEALPDTTRTGSDPERRWPRSTRSSGHSSWSASTPTAWDRASCGRPSQEDAAAPGRGGRALRLRRLRDAERSRASRSCPATDGGHRAPRSAVWSRARTRT